MSIVWLLAGVSHTLLIVLFLMPKNPLSERDWHLLSLRPPASSLHLWVRCTFHGGEGVSMREEIRVSGNSRAKRFEHFLVLELWSQANRTQGEKKPDLSALQHGDILAKKTMSKCVQMAPSRAVQHMTLEITQLSAVDWSANRNGQKKARVNHTIEFLPVTPRQLFGTRERGRVQ